MNYLCKVNGKVIEVDDIKDKHLKQKFEIGARELLKRVPSLNSINEKTKVVAYFENDLLRFRLNLSSYRSQN